MLNKIIKNTMTHENIQMLYFVYNLLNTVMRLYYDYIMIIFRPQIFMHFCIFINLDNIIIFL